MTPPFSASIKGLGQEEDLSREEEEAPLTKATLCVFSPAFIRQTPQVYFSKSEQLLDIVVRLFNSELNVDSGSYFKVLQFFFLPQGRGGEGARCQFKQCQIQSFLLLFVFKGSFFSYAYSKVKTNKQTNQNFCVYNLLFSNFFKEKNKNPQSQALPPNQISGVDRYPVLTGLIVSPVHLLLFCTLKGFDVICHFVAVMHLKGGNKDSILMCILQAPNVLPREVKYSLPAGQMSQRFLTVNAKPERRRSAHSASSSSETYSPLANLSGETWLQSQVVAYMKGQNNNN